MLTRITIFQTLKASTALLSHIRATSDTVKAKSGKQSLLEGADSDSEAENSALDDTAIWLCLTTKKHLADKNRLKPSKIAVPHSIYQSPSIRICLITTDPQRAVKDVLQDPTFPKPLSAKIGRVIGFQKLKKKYHSFESRRQLLAQHDVFFADERIITRLVETLGKVFYSSTRKRPIPIRLAQVDKVDGKRVKHGVPSNYSSKLKAKQQPPSAAIASPAIVAKEIESALSMVPLSLRPATTCAIQVGRASFTPAQLSTNISTVATALASRYVSGGWRNMKAMHIKSPESTALPIWLADEMWAEDGDVIGVDEEEEARQRQKREKAERRAARKQSQQSQQDQQKRKVGQQDDDSEDMAEKRQKSSRDGAAAGQIEAPRQVMEEESRKPKKRKVEKEKHKEDKSKLGKKTAIDTKLLEAARSANLAQQKAVAFKAHG